MTNKDFDGDIAAGTTLEIGVIIHFTTVSPNIIKIDFNSDGVCEETGVTTTTSSSQENCLSNYDVETETANYWQGKIKILVPEDVSDWSVGVLFDNDVTYIDCALADVSGVIFFNLKALCPANCHLLTRLNNKV